MEHETAFDINAIRSAYDALSKASPLAWEVFAKGLESHAESIEEFVSVYHEAIRLKSEYSFDEMSLRIVIGNLFTATVFDGIDCNDANWSNSIRIAKDEALSEIEAYEETTNLSLVTIQTAREAVENLRDGFSLEELEAELEILAGETAKANFVRSCSDDAMGRINKAINEGKLLGDAIGDEFKSELKWLAGMVVLARN